jgi:minichromosome maintenance protein 10
MSNAPTHKRKHDYDPRKQWGLKPEDSTASAGATYMISGHIVSGSSSDPRTVYAAESIGREGQAKAKRKMAGKDADKALTRLLERDKDGMKAVMKAREVGHGGGAVKTKGEKKKKKTKAGKGTSSEDESSTSDNSRMKDTVRKTAYSADIIKSLGFDPSMKPGQRRPESTGTKNKV